MKLALSFTVLSCAALASLARAEAAPGDGAYLTADSLVTVGDHVLDTRLYRPAGLVRFPVVLLVFGSGDLSMKSSAAARELTGAFTAQGIGVLAYDKRGTGASTGAFTGSDFKALGKDAAALVRFLRKRPEVECVGIWGISQFGWMVPNIVRDCPDLQFAIIVSPAGVNPFEQVAWFLRQQALGWGLSAQEADAADRLHRAVALYYAGRSSHSEAQAEVDRHRSARWFQRVTSHPYWDEMPSGRVLTPDSLARALRLRPLDFEVYRAVSSFADYRQDYAVLRGLPTLIVYGGADELVPVVQSKPLFEDALRADRRFPHGFRTFDGASHDIATPDGRLLPEYLTAISEWARARFSACRER